MHWLIKQHKFQYIYTLFHIRALFTNNQQRRSFVINTNTRLPIRYSSHKLTTTELQQRSHKTTTQRRSPFVIYFWIRRRYFLFDFTVKRRLGPPKDSIYMHIYMYTTFVCSSNCMYSMYVMYVILYVHTSSHTCM